MSGLPRERGYKRAYQVARDTFAASPWGTEYESRFQTAAECNEAAADVVHETRESGTRQPCESTADFLSRAKAEAQTAGQLIRAQAGAGRMSATPEQAAQAWADTNPAQTRARTPGRHTAGQQITSPAAAGMPADRPARHAPTPAERESAGKMSDAEIDQELADELMDRELARRDIADRSLMDAAAAMRYSRPKPGLYELHSRLDNGHLDAARQLIAGATADTQHQAEAG